MPKTKIAPSILSADFGKLNEEIARIEPFADLIHVDVMDGHFVPSITLGEEVVKRIRSKKPLDVHLMISNPDLHLEGFVKAGAASLTVHAEVCPGLRSTLERIRELGAKASVALKPATPLEKIRADLDSLDMVLLMTVNPGFGGQPFMESVLPKIKELRQMAPNLDIQVDGGITPKTARRAKEAGANVFVAGSFIFGKPDPAKAIQELRNALE